MQTGDAAGALFSDHYRKVGQLRPRFRLFLHCRGGGLFLLAPERRGRAAKVKDQALPEHIGKRGPAGVTGELIAAPPDAVLRLHRRIEGEE
jgi:hypothetical protein